VYQGQCAEGVVDSSLDYLDSSDAGKMIEHLM
jgi:hypothetical protein